MRPLFWERILLTDAKEAETLWAAVEEPQFDVPSFEACFSQKAREGKETVRIKAPPAVETFSLLGQKRAQAAGILMGSLKLDPERIGRAIYTMDDKVLSLESAKALYELRFTAEELDVIRLHDEAVRSGGAASAAGERGRLTRCAGGSCAACPPRRLYVGAVANPLLRRAHRVLGVQGDFYGAAVLHA